MLEHLEMSKHLETLKHLEMLEHLETLEHLKVLCLKQTPGGGGRRDSIIIMFGRKCLWDSETLTLYQSMLRCSVQPYSHL